MTSRMTSARGLVLIVAVAMVAAACSSGSGGGSTASDDSPGSSAEATDTQAPNVVTLPPAEPEEVEETPQSGGVVRFGMEADSDGLNPTSSALAAAGLLMTSAVFDGLAVWNADREPVPFLAESWESNETFDEWTLHLRPDIKFHDGTAFNAEAVVANFTAQYNNLLVGQAVKPFYDADNPIEVIDDLTVLYHLSTPQSLWPGTLATQLGLMASPTWIAAALEDPSLTQRPVGTGPFIFDSREPDSVTRFVRNPDWFNGDVWLDAVEFYPVTDTDIRIDQFLANDLDAVNSSAPNALARLRDEPDIQTLADDTGEETFVMINATAPPFDDIRAREALARATPKEQYLALIGEGEMRPADQMFTPDSIWFNPDIVDPTDDIEGARLLVESYCADVPANCTGDGKIIFHFKYSGPSVVQDRIADLFSNSWNELFEVTTSQHPQDEFIRQVATGDYQTALYRLFGAVEPTRDAVWILCATAEGIITLNFARSCTQRVDDNIATENSGISIEERIPVRQDTSLDIAERFIFIFLNHTTWVTSFNAKVRGICDATAPGDVAILCTNNGRPLFGQMWIAG